MVYLYPYSLERLGLVLYLVVVDSRAEHAVKQGSRYRFQVRYRLVDFCSAGGGLLLLSNSSCC